MPELPEVETVVRGLKRNVLGKKIIGLKVNLAKIINTNLTKFKKYTLKAKIVSAQRRAKIIIVHLSNGYSLGIHLKISGKLLYLKRKESIEKHTHVIFNLNNGYDLRFWDLRRFGYVRVFPTSKIHESLKLEKLGPEPLKKSFDLKYFKEILRKRLRSKIKPLLLDQAFISGIGNLYADEILYYARIHPLKKVNSLTEKQIKYIFSGIKKILPEAIRQKGSSVDLYVDIKGKAGNYSNYLKAYSLEDEPCQRCKKPIRRIKIGSRSAYFCGNCQRK